MTALVILEPEETSLTLAAEETSLIFESDAVQVVLDVGDTLIEVAFDEGSHEVVSQDVELVVATEQVVLQLYSDIAPGNGAIAATNSVFLATPDVCDESSSVYFYFGWESVSGSWLVRRQERLTSISKDATVTTNSQLLAFDSAWVARENLSYV